jgi:hypothetical protein
MSRRPWLHQPRIIANPLGWGLIALKAGQAVSMAGSLAMSAFNHRVGFSNRSEG